MRQGPGSLLSVRFARLLARRVGRFDFTAVKTPKIRQPPECYVPVSNKQLSVHECRFVMRTHRMLCGDIGAEEVPGDSVSTVPFRVAVRLYTEQICPYFERYFIRLTMYSREISQPQSG